MYQQPWQTQGAPASQAPQQQQQQQQGQQQAYGAPAFPWQNLQDSQGAQPQAQQQPQQQSPYAAYYQQQAPQQAQQQQVAQAAPGQSPWGPAMPAQQPAAQQQQQQQAYYQLSAAGPAPTQQQAPAAAPGVRVWLGTVTQLLPPNYGIVDGDAYYIQPVVVGDIPKVGDRVRCEGVANTEGGAYRWRVTRLELDRPQAAAGNSHMAPAPGVADQGTAGAYLQAAYTAAPLQQQAPRPGPRPPPRSGSGMGPGGRGPINLTEEQREKLTSEKYNVVAPPMAQYSSEVAMAAVEMSLGGGAAAQPAPAAPQVDRAAIFGRGPSSQALDEEAQKKAHATVTQLGMDPASNPGARLLAKMGFGAVGTGLGRNQQGISAPINPVAVQGSVGLGFDAEAVAEQERKEREERRAAREREREERLRERRERRRSRSRSRSRSPARRYAVTTPKFPTFEADKGVAAISKRYKDLYMPSDFVKVRPLWLHTCHESDPFPIDEPFSFDIIEPEKDGKDKDVKDKDEKEKEKDGKDLEKDGKEIEKEKEGADKEGAPTSPAAPAGPAGKTALTPEEIASGRRWSARVALLSGMAPASLYAGPKDSKLWHNPAKKLQFLVLKTGRREYGLIGGPWDPVDGGHPASDPNALVKTAVRHFKAATGVDLSACPRWARFTQHTYLRPGSSNRGEGEHLDNSVVFLVGGAAVSQEDPSALESLEKARGAAAAEDAAWKEVEEAEQALKDAEKAAKEAAEKIAGKTLGGSGGLDAGLANLDANSLNVQQLQEKLTERGLDTKWNPLKGKKELVDRLQEYINQKKEALAAEDAEFKAAEDSKAAVGAAEKRIKEARERHRSARSSAKSAERLLSDPPAPRRLTLRPAGEALDRKGRGQLAGASLEALLDYSEDDTREAGCEVALFAEAFQEMLQQRFGRAVLRALCALEASKASSKKESKGDGGKSPAAKESKGDKEKAGEEAGGNSEAGEKEGEGGEEKGAGGEDSEMVEAGAEGKKRAAEAKGDTVVKRARTEEPASPGAAGTAGAEAGHLENLLTACRFYDRECAGYLLDEDLEEIAYMVTDDLSRKRVQSVVDSIVKRGKFSYVDHVGMRIPPAQQAQRESDSGGSVSAGQQQPTSGGTAEEVEVLQRQLSQAERARKLAAAAKVATEQKLAEAEAKRAEAQQAAKRAAEELEHIKEKLADAETNLAARSNGAAAEAARALEILSAAEGAAAKLRESLSELGSVLGREAEAKQE